MKLRQRRELLEKIRGHHVSELPRLAASPLGTFLALTEGLRLGPWLPQAFPMPRAYVKPPAGWREHAVGTLAKAFLHEALAVEASGRLAALRGRRLWPGSK